MVLMDIDLEKVLESADDHEIIRNYTHKWVACLIDAALDEIDGGEQKAHIEKVLAKHGYYKKQGL